MATAREVMRKVIAWQSICDDRRLQDQLTRAQIDDTKEKAKTSRDGAAKAVRLAWSHILFPVKATAAGTAFDLDHLSITSRDRAAIPAAVYEKAGPRGDGIARERLGPDALALHLDPLWPKDQPHLLIAEVADWFASYAYLPKLRDRVVLENANREAIGKLDAVFGYADSFDEDAGRYLDLAWRKAAPEIFSPKAVLVRGDIAAAQSIPVSVQLDGKEAPDSTASVEDGTRTPHEAATGAVRKPHRFFGAVELDLVRPVKAFDAILAPL